MSRSLIPRSEFDRVRAASGDDETKLRLFADMCRLNTLIAVKTAGSGHLGSSFSAADIVTYLYLHELNVLSVGLDSPDRDVYFSSKGHDVPGLYALLAAVGILPEGKLLELRRLGGLDGHPDVRIPGIEANTGSLGMGLAKAKGMARAKALIGAAGWVYVLTGDGEFQEGQIWESLQVAAHQKIDRLIAIMDRNKFQTDRPVSEVNDIEDLVQKISAFGWHVQRTDGHDFRALKAAVATAKSVSGRPKFIVADTIKGKGVSFMERAGTDASGRRLYAWHAGAPDQDHFLRGVEEIGSRIQELAGDLDLAPIGLPEIVVPAAPPAGLPKEYVADAFGEALCEIGRRNERLVVLDADLAADCRLRAFEREFPDRFIENGIAEQDMVSTAGGLARLGLLPVVNSFAAFLASRANEQIYNNATEGTKIVYVFHYAGLIPAGPGKSHQSLRDISLLRALPNVVVIQPGNARETKMAAGYALEQAEESCVLRLAIGPSPAAVALPPDYTLRPGRGVALTEGADAVLIAYGPVMLNEALTAARILKRDGFGLKVVNMPWLNRIDADWIQDVIGSAERIYVLEDHSGIGGLGDGLREVLSASPKSRRRDCGIIAPVGYPECGRPLEVLRWHGLDGVSLAEIVTGRDFRSLRTNGAELHSAEAPQ